MSRKPKKGNTQINAGSDDVIVGEIPSEEDNFYISWGRESIKNNLIISNEVLRQFTTISTTLLGGSAIFLDDKVIDIKFKPWIIIFFLFSLIFSFLGIIPYEGYVDLRVPNKIKEHKEKALKCKINYIYIAGGFCAAGFLLVFAGLYCK